MLSEENTIIPNPARAELLTSDGGALSSNQTGLWCDYSENMLRIVVREIYINNTENDLLANYILPLDNNCFLLDFQTRSKRITREFKDFDLMAPAPGYPYKIDLGSIYRDETIIIEYAYCLFTTPRNDGSLNIIVPGLDTSGSNASHECGDRCDIIRFTLRNFLKDIKINTNFHKIIEPDKDCIRIYPDVDNVFQVLIDKVLSENRAALESGETDMYTLLETLPRLDFPTFRKDFILYLENCTNATGESDNSSISKKGEFFKNAKAYQLTSQYAFLSGFFYERPKTINPKTINLVPLKYDMPKLQETPGSKLSYYEIYRREIGYNSGLFKSVLDVLEKTASLNLNEEVNGKCELKLDFGVIFSEVIKNFPPNIGLGFPFWLLLVYGPISVPMMWAIMINRVIGQVEGWSAMYPNLKLLTENFLSSLAPKRKENIYRDLRHIFFEPAFLESNGL